MTYKSSTDPGVIQEFLHRLNGVLFNLGNDYIKYHEYKKQFYPGGRLEKWNSNYSFFNMFSQFVSTVK